jgi:hypothetical protein
MSVLEQKWGWALILDKSSVGSLEYLQEADALADGTSNSLVSILEIAHCQLFKLAMFYEGRSIRD